MQNIILKLFNSNHNNSWIKVLFIVGKDSTVIWIMKLKVEKQEQELRHNNCLHELKSETLFMWADQWLILSLG